MRLTTSLSASVSNNPVELSYLVADPLKFPSGWLEHPDVVAMDKHITQLRGCIYFIPYNPGIYSGFCQTSNADNIPIPEPIGVISAAVYLIVMFIFIPFPVYEWSQYESSIPHQKFLMFLSALTAICSAVLLGFADDVLDLRWRHKLLFPTLSSLPLLLVYYISGSSATIVLPSLAQRFFPVDKCIDIGIFYYVYMGMMVVFCTNAINILAGINGLEAGQAFVIAASVVIFNAIEATRVFVGDTFCYWAGMTLASACILGHFSKTMALFLVPQVINFIYSAPQLLHLVPCPRHRLPKYNSKTNTVDMSTVEFKESDIRYLTKIVLYFLDVCGLLHKRIIEKDDARWTVINNLTLLNLILKFTGPMHEKKLTQALLILQVSFSVLAFFIRFYVAYLMYEVVL
uniref:UDP-N-acetylglucosamine--dolichyl-phosphate N-acetylglucosaminephosphotransferase n=1 Tax=Setaria digitata TaxID=48799 RepID=A0A915PUT0_9BILA